MGGLIIAMVVVGAILGVHTLGDERFPQPKTAACLQQAERGVDATHRQNSRNECWYNKGARKN